MHTFVSLQYFSVFVITYSKNERRLLTHSFTHKHTFIGITGQTAETANSRPRQCVCVCVDVCAVTSGFNRFTATRHQTPRQNRMAGFPCRRDRSEAKHQSASLISVVFATPCQQHTSLFLVCACLLRAIKCRISRRQAADSSTACPLFGRR